MKTRLSLQQFQSSSGHITSLIHLRGGNLLHNTMKNQWSSQWQTQIMLSLWSCELTGPSWNIRKSIKRLVANTPFDCFQMILAFCTCAKCNLFFFFFFLLIVFFVKCFAACPVIYRLVGAMLLASEQKKNHFAEF